MLRDLELRLLVYLVHLHLEEVGDRRVLEEGLGNLLVLVVFYLGLYGNLVLYLSQI